MYRVLIENNFNIFLVVVVTKHILFISSKKLHASFTCLSVCLIVPFSGRWLDAIPFKLRLLLAVKLNDKYAILASCGSILISMVGESSPSDSRSEASVLS